MRKLLYLLAFGFASAFSLQGSAATLAIGAEVYLPPTDRSDSPSDPTAAATRAAADKAAADKAAADNAAADNAAAGRAAANKASTDNAASGRAAADKAAAVPAPADFPVLWVPAANGTVPANAIIGGNEAGRPLPVCRAIYNKGVHPGKVVGKNCNFGYGGKEVLAPQYDVLVGNPAVLNKSPQLVRWIAAQGGQVPLGAFFGAYEPGRPILPICQAPYQGGVHVGKVVGRNCNFGYGGLEVLSPQYAVLVVG